ncbi:MAG TPA: hypothetical protein VF094_02090 [Gaiellaceae bacterium]
MVRVAALTATFLVLAACAATGAAGGGLVSWRTVGSATAGKLPAGPLLPPASFSGTATGAEGPAGWRVIVFSSAAEVAHALPALAPPVRHAVARARTSTNFGYRRLLLVATVTRAGCCPVAVAGLQVAGGAAELTLRQLSCGSCTAPGGSRVLLLSVPRTTFPLPARLALQLQPPPSCPAGYSYAGFVSSPASGLTATLTMNRLPGLVSPMDHALAYASIVARDADQVPREWLQVGIGRGAIGTYQDDGLAWVYVEAQTVGGYQLTELEQVAAGVSVVVAFSGSGAAWTVSIDGRQAYTADLGVPATGTSAAVEVYRATGGGTCPSVDFALSGVVPRGDQRGLLPVLDESADGWRVRLGEETAALG